MVPEGFTFLGAGCSRSAYLGPDGWVYKVGDFDANAREIRNAHTLSSNPRLPVWAYIPTFEFVCEVTHERSVIRTEYFTHKVEKNCYWCEEDNCIRWNPEGRYCDGGCHCGMAVCWRERTIELMNSLYLCDLHYENVMMIPENGDYTLVIIDIGEYL